MACYRRETAGLEYRPRTRPPVDGSGRLAQAHGSEGGPAGCGWGPLPVLAGLHVGWVVGGGWWQRRQ